MEFGVDITVWETTRAPVPQTTVELVDSGSERVVTIDEKGGYSHFPPLPAWLCSQPLARQSRK